MEYLVKIPFAKVSPKRRGKACNIPSMDSINRIVVIKDKFVLAMSVR